MIRGRHAAASSDPARRSSPCLPPACCRPAVPRRSTSPDASASIQNGAELFSARCSGCHTLDSAGAQGSATKVSDRERVDGPNLNVRKVCYEDALYALRNGGSSGAIMPANIVVGQDAKDVAAYIAEYSGTDAANPASPSGPAVTCPPPPAGS